MKLKFLKAEYGIEFKIPNEFLKVLNDTFSKKANLAVFSAIQFTKNLNEVKELIENNNYIYNTSKPLRAAVVGQILGCDSHSKSLNLDLSEIDGFIYIGDGYFHPQALLLSQENEDKIKPIVVVNVVEQKIEVMTSEVIEKYMKKKKGNLTRFYLSETIGVFVSSKWGQEYKESSLKLKNMYSEKEFYFFTGDNFNEMEMENFPYIECWINTACPRIGQDDILRHKKALINIKDIWKDE